MNRWFLMCLMVISITACWGGPDPIQEVNKRVATIDAHIGSGDYPLIMSKEILVTEGRPPEFMFYYDPSGLVATEVSVGHETWLIKYRYYFYPNGQLMKYIEEIEGRPDNPPKLAIIYGADGKIIWSNTDEVKAGPEQIKGLYNSYQDLKRMYQGY